MKTYMKLYNKFARLLVISLSVSGIFIGCSEEELPNGGKPMVSYVRVTRPTSSDSLLIAAGQGQMVAIMGENLRDIRQLWFNDQRAVLNPSFITDKTVITRVPSQIPENITNQMRMIFGNGEELIYDFEVAISEPVLSYMMSEYVNTGDTAIIVGNFFYEPLTVTFTGDVQGEVILREDERLEIVVPEGAQPGPITVSTNFGVTKSNFWFRDNRNVFGSMEVTDFNGWWWGSEMIVATDPRIPPVDNKFLRVNQVLGTGQWFEFFVGTGGAMALETQKIPAEAIENPALYSLKFEINTLSSLAGAKIRMYIGNSMTERNDNNFTWQPNLNTGGQWETVTIPFKSIIDKNPGIKVDPAGYGISFWFWEGAAVTANFGVDNFRVVPNVSED
ncbi:MAG TPA: glycan-binding surface protein [Chryseosolibacter sp.]